MSSICLHRIHEHNGDVPSSYHELNMSISLNELLKRLEDLHKENEKEKTNSLVTFDDGWSDVLAIPADFFRKNHSLTPVVFLTDAQIKEMGIWLPLHQLYEWMQTEQHNLNDLRKMNIVRDEIKNLREEEQLKFLEKKGIYVDKKPTYLTKPQISLLKNRGWKIASHGPEHSDLRRVQHQELEKMLHHSMGLIQHHGFLPWIAWPEGRWDNQIAHIANKVGFTQQFGLMEEVRHGDSAMVEMRTLW